MVCRSVVGWKETRHGTLRSMNIKRRYLCVASAIAVVCLVIIATSRRSADADTELADDDDETNTRQHYVGGPEYSEQTTWTIRRRYSRPRSGDGRYCRMSTCFDLSRCRHGFTVHIHPSPEVAPPTSFKYSEILRALRASRYYTDDPERACIFVLGIDTLDRDRLSTEYVANIRSKIDSLRWWRGGVNHVVFNLYSGTWPDYNEDGLGFDVGRSMLAKASSSRLFYRPGFDISFPLFHREHSFRGGEPGALMNSQAPPVRKYLLSFKGKRYLVGIGSETRNSLYHIQNGQDIILLTTCKHGKGWKSMEDRRCEMDNLQYERFVNTFIVNLAWFYMCVAVHDIADVTGRSVVLDGLSCQLSMLGARTYLGHSHTVLDWGQKSPQTGKL